MYSISPVAPSYQSPYSSLILPSGEGGGVVNKAFASDGSANFDSVVPAPWPVGMVAGDLVVIGAWIKTNNTIDLNTGGDGAGWTQYAGIVGGFLSARLFSKVLVGTEIGLTLFFGGGGSFTQWAAVAGCWSSVGNPAVPDVPTSFTQSSTSPMPCPSLTTTVDMERIVRFAGWTTLDTVIPPPGHTQQAFVNPAGMAALATRNADQTPPGATGTVDYDTATQFQEFIHFTVGIAP